MIFPLEAPIDYIKTFWCVHVCIYMEGGGNGLVFLQALVFGTTSVKTLRGNLCQKSLKFCAKRNFLESLVVFRVHNDLFQSNQCSFNQVNVRFQTF